MREKLKLIKQSIQNNQGFTFVELMIVIAILALLGTLAVSQYKRIIPDSRIKLVTTDFRTFETALEVYAANYGQYPATEEGLQALVTAGLIKNTKNALNDPWGNPYNYRYPGNFSDGPEIWSYGADGKEGGEGDNADIVNWE